jgi:hypothetical protein
VGEIGAILHGRAGRGMLIIHYNTYTLMGEVEEGEK